MVQGIGEPGEELARERETTFRRRGPVDLLGIENADRGLAGQIFAQIAVVLARCDGGSNTGGSGSVGKATDTLTSWESLRMPDRI